MNIAEVTPQRDFTLLVRADNGQIGVFDVRPYLKFDAFRSLENIEEFLNIANGYYFVEWHSGADISADTIFAKWQNHTEGARPYAPRDAPQAACS